MTGHQSVAGDPTTGERTRTLSGLPGICAKTFLILIAVTGLGWAGDVPSYTGMTFYIEQYLAVFLGLALAATFLRAPARARDSGRVPWYDACLVITAIACSGYIAVLYPEMASTLSSTAPDRSGSSGWWRVSRATASPRSARCTTA